MSTLKKLCLWAVVFFILAFLSAFNIPQSFAAVDEEFSSGSLSGYTVYIPGSGPTISAQTRAGYVKFVVPSSSIFNHDSTVDKAPQLRRVVTESVWELETKAEFRSAAGTGFHTGLMVYFSRYDCYYWGFYGATNTLALGRSGKGIAFTKTYSGGSSVDLRIRRDGMTFYFEYRTPGSTTWTLGGSQTITTVPQAVGLIAKTSKKMRVEVDFDYLRFKPVVTLPASNVSPSDGTTMTLGDTMTVTVKPPSTYTNPLYQFSINGVVKQTYATISTFAFSSFVSANGLYKVTVEVKGQSEISKLDIEYYVYRKTIP